LGPVEVIVIDAADAFVGVGGEVAYVVVETVLESMWRQKMTGFEWQTKGIYEGIAGAIASQIAAV
jgi:hypothetical protein